jgi:hypothetical protein
MRKNTLIVGSVAMLLILAPAAVYAQSPPTRTTAPPPQISVTAQPQPPQECLRALDGSCTKPELVEAAGKRAEIMSSVRVSYFGTPVGTVGGNYIPYERFFRDNEIVFGLPTYTCVACNVVQRTK